MKSMKKESSGIKDLDKKLGGLLIGDNVILEAESGTFPELFIKNFVQSAINKNNDVVYVAFNTSPLTLCSGFEKMNVERLTLLDCFTAGKGKNEKVFRDFYTSKDHKIEVIKVELPHMPNYFHRVFDTLTAKKGNYTRYVFDSVTGMLELWRTEERVKEFYTHTCPMLFDTKTIAYWLLDKYVHSSSFKAHLEHVGQVVIELNRRSGGLFLQVKKAVERYREGIYDEHQYEVSDKSIKFLKK